MAREGKKSVRHVVVDKIFVVLDGSLPISIDKQVIEVNIYQDLYEPFMTCEILFEDALGFYSGESINKLRQPGFTGNDIFIINYTTTFPDDNIPSKSQAFVLYDVTARTRSKEKSEVFALTGISIEGWLSVDKKISRSYGHNTKKNTNTISHYVNSIVDEFVYNRQAKDVYDSLTANLKMTIKKKNTYDETNSRIPYIVPNLEPISAIKTLMREADNDKDTNLFTFYEDSIGFHFADVSKLVDKKFVDTFTYEPSNAAEGGQSKSMVDLKKIFSYEVIKQTNSLESKMMGLFKSKTINIDIIKKNKTEVVYNYDISGPKLPKLNSGNLPHKHIVSGTSSSDAKVYMRTSRIGHDSYKLFEPEHHLPKKSNTLLGKRESYIEHLANIMMSVILNGDSELNVGDKINLVIPKATTIGNDKEANIDKYLSGYYMITKLRHIIKGDNMDTVIEVMKDTESTAPITQPHTG